MTIGLSPLTLMCLGLMSRVYVDFMSRLYIQTFDTNSSYSNQAVGEPISSKIYKGLNLAGLVALCLGVYGGTKQANSDSTDFTHVNNDSKIAVVLFTAIFIIAFFMFLILVSRLSLVPHGEKRLLLAVGLSWPFLTVRYIYAIVADFAQNKNFNSFYGNATVYLIMAVSMEFIVVAICEIIGFTLHVLPKGEPLNTSDTEMHGSHMPVSSGDSYAYGENVPLSNDLASPKMLPRRQAKGPISWLYIQAKDRF